MPGTILSIFVLFLILSSIPEVLTVFTLISQMRNEIVK